MSAPLQYTDADARRALELVLRISLQAASRRVGPAHTTYVPWDTVEDCRRLVTDLGIDWAALKRELKS